ncbi:MAG: Asp23/Gls24 family envelope stress response protein [Lachnospiraceae bacterium]|nr:Asp23/Gls24 family envelope stress response protein [Lachnospiraceae bacterium]MBP5248566.1 Asp23/Gls24 family envelope stress response protein [Lachnospiraceae bacterium]
MSMESIKYSQTEDFSSEVKISSDVIATIAALAATEVEGIDSLQGNITNEIIGKLGIKNVSKGVEITFDPSGENVEASIAAVIKYGYSIPDIVKTVQDKVKSAIESMVGLNCTSVNIDIVGVNVNKK